MNGYEEQSPQAQTAAGRVQEHPSATAGQPAGVPGTDSEPADAGLRASGSDAGPEDEALQGDVDELVAVARQRDDYLALAQRTQADFENYRKRVARESQGAIARGMAKVVKELLPALDNLERALAEAPAGDPPAEPSPGARQDGPEESPAGEPFVAGVRLVRDEISAALSRLGVESFAPLGERFDPAEHEAMAQVPGSDAESGCIVEVYQQGYRLGETIIRPARVLVAA